MRNPKFVIFIILAILVSCSTLVVSAAAFTPLVHKNERVLFSFKLVKSNKITTVAISTTKPEYIVYRFGTNAKVELEFPKDKTDSWCNFTFSYYFRGGGVANEGLDLNYLHFKNEEYTYTIYQEYYAPKDETSIGIRVKNNETGKEVEMIGDPLSQIGSLYELRDDKRIKQECNGR